VAPATTLVGAGGVRRSEDLARAAAAGAGAWLVASALHDLQLPRQARS
jgi:phosphoribosylformimino-5-aminoimidazole carboxamide ribotide isomerase